jgi:hypothetical protein
MRNGPEVTETGKNRNSSIPWHPERNSKISIKTADGGKQRVDSDARYSIWSALVGLQSHRRAPILWRGALEVTNNAVSMFSHASDSYRYTSLNAYLFIPLR